MTISEALTASAAVEGWSPARIASTCSVSEQTARRWLAGVTIPPGDKLLVLQRELPGFAQLVAQRQVRHAS
jgi:Homeodomain-like domain